MSNMGSNQYFSWAVGNIQIQLVRLISLVAYNQVPWRSMGWVLTRSWAMLKAMHSGGHTVGQTDQI